jgi:hypothetical protein
MEHDQAAEDPIQQMQMQMHAVLAQQEAQMAQQMAQQEAQAAQHIAQQQAQMEQLHLNANQWQAEAAQANANAAANANAGAAANPANAHGPGHAAVNGMPRGYRPEGPPKFHGRTGEDVESWLFQIEEGNRLFPIEDQQQRIRYVALALRETAAKWYAAMQMSEPPQIHDWDSFVAKLRQQFVALNARWIARNQMHTLKQVGSVREYSVKFRNLRLQIPDMSQADAFDRYVRGLKDHAHKVWRKKWETLEAAMVYAEELDLESQQKQALSRSSNFGRDKPRLEQRHEEQRHMPWQSKSEPRNFHRGGPTPMELGMLRRDPPRPAQTRMNDAERARHMDQDLCFFCHKPGHRANRCPSKKGQGNGNSRR